MITNGFSCAARAMTITTTAMQPVFFDEIRKVFFDLRWMLAFIVCLILADFWFGVSDSLYNKEHFRFSRAGRRTCNKFCDYICYLMIGTFIGLAIFEPLNITNHIVTAALGLGLGCLWEIDSIVGHVCSLHGVTNKFSIKRFLISLIKRKNEDLGCAVEEGLKDSGKEE